MQPYRSFLLFFAVTLSALTSSAQENPVDSTVDAFKPNKTISELVLSFGTDPQAAERTAMIQSWKIAREGVFKVKNISLSSIQDQDYCILTISHEIYEPSDTKRVDEMVVGYGSDARSALHNARVRATQRIRENPRSRPNLRNSTLPVSSREFLPMASEDERDFIETKIRFWGNGSTWRVYLNFSYLEMK